MVARLLDLRASLILLRGKLSSSRTWTQIIQTSGAKVFSLLASMAALAITARYLGPEGRGTVAAAVSWVTLFATFGSLSTGQVLIHVAAANRDRNWLSPALGTIGLIVAIVTLLSWLSMFLAYSYTNGDLFSNLTPQLLFIAFVALPILLLIENNLYLMMAINALRILNTAEVIGSMINILAIVGFVVVLGLGVTGALLAFVAGRTTTVAICGTFAFMRAKRISFDRHIARQLITGGLKLHLNAIGTYLFLQANILIINYFRPAAETGYYQLAVQLIGIIQILPASIGTVVYSTVANRGPDEAWPAQRRILGQAMLLTLLLMVAAYIFAPLAVAIVAGPEFAASILLFRMLLLALPGLTMSAIMASQWIGRGLFLQTALLTFASGIISVMVSWLLIPRYGMYGATWATVATYLFSIAGNGCMAVWVEQRWRRYQAIL